MAVAAIKGKRALIERAQDFDGLAHHITALGVALQLTPKTARAENLPEPRPAAKPRKPTSTVALMTAQLDQRLRHITAVMRKLSVLANTLLRDDRKQTERLT